MFIFSTAKKGLLAGFKTRFSENPEGDGYLFYPKESEKGYACSETDFLKFTADFQRFLKWMTRFMWFWFLVPMLLIIVLAVWQGYELNNLEIIIIILLPLPFVALKGWKVYIAPEILVKGKRPVANYRNQRQIKESRIKGMSWSILIAMAVLPIISSYVFLTDVRFEEWRVALGVCFFITASIISFYFLIRKWKIMKQENKK